MSRQKPARFVSPEWEKLDAALQKWRLSSRAPGEDRNWLRLNLLPFIFWCDRNKVDPESVNDDAVRRFIASWEGRGTEARLRRSWNKAAEEVPDWPTVRVSQHVPMHLRPTYSEGQIVTLPEHEFHPSLCGEIEKFCQNRGFLDPEREALSQLSHRERLNARLAKLHGQDSREVEAAMATRRPRPLSESTIRDIRKLIYTTATALHLAGEAELSDLRRIEDVTTPKGAAVLADSIVKRLGAERAANRLYPFFCVRWLARIARRCGIAFTYAEQLAWNELSLDLLETAIPGPGPCERNLKLMLQLDDPKKFSMLVALPDVMMAELERARARRGKPTVVEARRAKSVIAIDILNTFPIRRRTLATLDLKRNFLCPPGGNTLLVIYPDQEKSRKLLEASLTERNCRLLSLYIGHYRPVLPGADRSSYLFPAATSKGYVSPTTFAGVIANIVKRRTGIHMHVNLWRHVMATKLGEWTQRAEDGGKLLGHIPNSSSTRRYVRLGTRLAAKQLREITDEARSQGIQLLMAGPE